MHDDFFETSVDKAVFTLIDEKTGEQAARHVAGCQGCSSDAGIPFEFMLNRVTGRDPAVTDYVMEIPARCPYCRREINVKTLIEPI